MVALYKLSSIRFENSYVGGIFCGPLFEKKKNSQHRRALLPTVWEYNSFGLTRKVGYTDGSVGQYEEKLRCGRSHTIEVKGAYLVGTGPFQSLSLSDNPSLSLSPSI